MHHWTYRTVLSFSFPSFFFFLLNKLQLSFCFMLLSQFIFHISFLDQCLVHSLIFLSESNFFTLSTVLYCSRSLILFCFCFCALIQREMRCLKSWGTTVRIQVNCQRMKDKKVARKLFVCLFVCFFFFFLLRQR